MNKLLAILLAGACATGAAVAQTPATGVNTGDLAGSNTASGTGAAAVGTTHTTTMEKRAARAGANTMGASGTAGTAGATGTLGASGDTGLCPPGMDKDSKDNKNCMPGSQVGKSAKPMGKAMNSDMNGGEAAQDRTEKR